MSGRDVPKARSNSNLDASPGKSARAMEEKKNADRPTPAATRLVVVARYPLLISTTPRRRLCAHHTIRE